MPSATRNDGSGVTGPLAGKGGATKITADTQRSEQTRRRAWPPAGTARHRRFVVTDGRCPSDPMWHQRMLRCRSNRSDQGARIHPKVAQSHPLPRLHAGTSGSSPSRCTDDIVRCGEPRPCVRNYSGGSIDKKHGCLAGTNRGREHCVDLFNPGQESIGARDERRPRLHTEGAHSE